MQLIIQLGWLVPNTYIGTTRSKWFQSNTCQRNKINDLIIGKLSGSGLSINPLVHITNSQSLIRIEKLKVKLICKMHHIKSPKSLDFESHFQHLPRICMLGYIWNNCHVAATHFFICILKAPDVVGVGQYILCTTKYQVKHQQFLPQFVSCCKIGN